MGETVVDPSPAGVRTTEMIVESRSDLACLSQSGTGFLARNGYLNVDVTLNGWLLVAHATAPLFSPYRGGSRLPLSS